MRSRRTLGISLGSPIVHDFAQYPMPERFVVTYNDGLGRYEATLQKARGRIARSLASRR